MRFTIHCNVAGRDCEILVESITVPGYSNCFKLSQNDKSMGYICKIGDHYAAPGDPELRRADLDNIGEMIEAHLL
jgi:hypothetical protein